MPLKIERVYDEDPTSSESEEEEKDEPNNDHKTSREEVNEEQKTRVTRREDEVIQYSGGSSKRPLFTFRADAFILNLTKHKTVAEEHHLVYNFSKGNCLLLQTLMACHGIRQQQVPEGKNPSDFNLLWTGGHLKTHWLSCLSPFQRVNHFPKSTELTRKDRLFQNIEHMQNSKGFEHFNIAPLTFILPREYHKFFLTARKEKCLWIVKPPASSRGRGIYLVDQPEKVTPDETAVVSQYISKPLLINSFKFDVRLYVAVTSFDPLVAYLYEDGLTRFATLPFDDSASSIVQQCMHLTNYSINKKSCHFVRNTDAAADDVGSKWSFKALLRHLQEACIDTTELMSSIEDVIIKSLISVEWIISSSCKAWVPHAGNCFELYGFDILIDHHLKPWLLEVNLTPSLACDSPLDLNIKTNVITDLLNLVGIECQDPGQPRTDTSRLQTRQKFMSKAQMKSMSSYMKRRRGVHLAMGRKGEGVVDGEGDRSEGEEGWEGEMSSGERRMVERVKGEWMRRGGFVRIFPTPNSWSIYGPLFVSMNKRNSLVHNHLFHSRHHKEGATDLVSRCVQYHRRLPTSLTLNLSNSDKGPLQDDHPFAKLISESVCHTEVSRDGDDGGGGGAVGSGVGGGERDGDDDIPLCEYFKHLITCKLAYLSLPQLKMVYREYLKRMAARKAGGKSGLDESNLDEVVNMIGGCGLDRNPATNHPPLLIPPRSAGVRKGVFTEGEVLRLLKLATTKDLQDLIRLHSTKDPLINGMPANLTNGTTPISANHRLDRAKSCKPIMRRQSRHALLNALDSKPKNRPITSTLARTSKLERNSNNHNHHNNNHNNSNNNLNNNNHNNNNHNNSTNHSSNQNNHSNNNNHHNNSNHYNHNSHSNNHNNNTHHNNNIEQLTATATRKPLPSRSFLLANDRVVAKEKLTSATSNKKLPISSSALTQALSIYGAQHASPPPPPPPSKHRSTSPLHLSPVGNSSGALPTTHTPSSIPLIHQPDHSTPPFEIRSSKKSSSFFNLNPKSSSPSVSPSSAHSSTHKSPRRHSKRRRADVGGGGRGERRRDADGRREKITECFNGGILLKKDHEKGGEGNEYDDDSFDSDDDDGADDDGDENYDKVHTIKSWSKKESRNHNKNNNNNLTLNANNRIEAMRKFGYNVVGCMPKHAKSFNK